MGTIKDIQDQYSAAHQNNVDLKKSMTELTAKLEQVESVLLDLNHKGIPNHDPRIVEYKEQKNQIEARKQKLSSAFKDNKRSIKAIEELIRTEFNPIQNMQQYDDGFPLLLFPLRLETRFKIHDNKKQLWLRVYPDECNIIKNESLLTEEELEQAKIFWLEMALAGDQEDNKRGAWKTLVNNFGSNRAQWIIDRFKPIDRIDQNTATVKKILILSTESDLQQGLKPEALAYWKAIWIAQGNKVLIAHAEAELHASNLTDQEKDSYIRQVLPYNIEDVILSDTDPSEIGVHSIIFPKSDEFITSKSSWNESPHAFGLPDKFVAVMYSNGVKTTHIFKYPVKYELPVGLDPSLANGEIQKDNGGIHLNQELRWMVDFEEAVTAGMASYIDLPDPLFATGFDQLFVVGLRVSTDAQKSTKVLEQLIQYHKADKQGFEFIKQGTPTNNTEDNPSGYSWQEDANESYERIFKGSENFTISNDSLSKVDGQIFAESLNISPDIFQTVRNANGKDQLETKAMNKALFPATIGYFMEEMMDPIFNDRDIKSTKDFFVENVSGRGPIPAFKIGRHPYGILPVCHFSKLNFSTNNEFHSASYPTRLKSLIQKMDDIWGNYVQQVSYLGKSGDAHQMLLNVLGLHANSVEFHQRYAQSIQQVYNQLNLEYNNPNIAAWITSAIGERGKKLLTELGVTLGDEVPPILEKFFLSKPNALKGPLVDDVPESEIKSIRNYSSDGMNYLQWLQQKDGNKIRLQDFGGNPAPKALLYLLLRHAILLSQANAASDLLLNKGIIKSKKIFYDTPFLYINRNKEQKSKYDHLYHVNQQVTNNATIKLVDYIYSNQVLADFLETQDLNQILKALKILEKTPTARLERLLVEHLDCCTYRLDAWKTALTSLRLNEQKLYAMRKKKEQGLYLGAYGMLVDLRPNKGNLEEKHLNAEDAAFFTANGEKLFVDSTNLGYIHAPSIDQAAAAAILRNNFESYKKEDMQNAFAINLTSERARIAKDFLEGMRNGQSLSALLGYQFERGLHDKYETSNIEADKFIFPLRLAYPLLANKLKSTAVKDSDLQEAEESNNSETSIEAIEARNVIDGLKLIQQAISGTVKTYPFGNSKLPIASATEIAAITQEINRLIDINDAIADLMMAEQVYQAVRGNFERASGVAEAFSKGAYPPEMEVLDTPRTGITLNHKMALHFNPEVDALISPINGIEMTVKAKSEPAVNEWLSEHLPSPDLVFVKVDLYLENDVQVIKDTKGQVHASIVKSPPTSIYVSQKNLGLQAIDLLFSALLDNEQAMTELDDRIVNYVYHHYKNLQDKPINPFTEISIAYTAEIDVLDKSKISFFELGSLLKSLKKLLANRQFVGNNSFRLPTANKEQPIAEYQINELKNRILLIKSGLNQLMQELDTNASGMVTQQAISDSLHAILSAHISDQSVLDQIQQQLAINLKSYFFDQSLINKDRIINEVVLSISVIISDPTVINHFRSSYEGYLLEYVSGFAQLSNQIENSCRLFIQVAFYDNNLTGTGYFHQVISSVFKKVNEKLCPLIQFMEKNWLEYIQLISTLSPVLSEKEKLAILKNAERKISSYSASPVPADLNAYRLLIETKASAFQSLLGDLKQIPLRDYVNVNDFVTKVQLQLDRLDEFVAVTFDLENNKNDMQAELTVLLLLREDVFVANRNLIAHLNKKLLSFDTLLSTIDLLQSDEEKIQTLITCAKYLIGEELILVPKLSFYPETAGQIEKAFQKSESILQFSKIEEQRLFPVEEWLSGVARVRSNVWHLENGIALTEAFNPTQNISLKALQFPIREDDRWLGLKFIGENENQADIIKKLAGDSLLYTAHFARDYDISKAVCGILIDDWTEVIPFREETTGITFHYNEPNSEPPQTLLLVLPSELSGNWNWEDLIGALENTLAMAKKRAVEPSMIDTSKFGQFLPSTLMAVTSNLITVSMNLAINNTVFDD